MSGILSEEDEAHRIHMKKTCDEIMELLKREKFSIQDGAFICIVTVANLIGQVVETPKEYRIKTAMDLAGHMVGMTNDVCDARDNGVEIDDTGEPMERGALQ